MQQEREAFLKHIRTRVEPPPVGKRAEVAYRSKIRIFFDWLGDRPITAAVLQEYRQHMQFEALGKHGGPGQKPRTIKQAFLALAEFFDWLRETRAELADLPDPRKVKRPRFSKHDHGGYYVPTEEEVERILAAPFTLPDFTVQERFARAQAVIPLALATECAFRTSDIIPLDWSDLIRTAEPWVIQVRGGKGEVHKTGIVNERLRKLLEAYIKAHAEWCALVPARKRNPALLPVNRSRRMDRDTLSLIRRRALKIAGLEGKRVRLHDFRHYRITEWLGVPGVNPATVAQMAGHKDVATTLTYAHPVEKEKQLAVEQSAGGSEPIKGPRAKPRMPRQKHQAGPLRRHQAGR